MLTDRRLLPLRLAVASLLMMAAGSRAIAESKPADGKTLDERHSKIVKMSQVERDRLQRNLANFEKLTAEQRDHYRQLNEQLEENSKTGGGLNSLMQTYSAWLQTLTPGQREQLRQETDSAKKLALVQKFKEEQYRGRIETIAVGGFSESEPTPPRSFRPQVLAPAELNDVLKMLLAELPSEDQIKPGKPLRPEDCVEILRRSIQQSPNPRSWPSTEVQEKILSSLPNPLRVFVRRNHGSQRESTAKFLFLSILEENRPKWPTAADLQQVVNDLDEGSRSRLEQQSPEDKRRILERRYFEPLERRRRELEQAIVGLMNEIGVQPPPPPPRNNEGPRGGPGERGGLFDGPPERRGPAGDRPRENGPPGERRRDGNRPLD